MQHSRCAERERDTEPGPTQKHTERHRKTRTQGRKDRKIILKYVNFARRKVVAKRSKKKKKHVYSDEWLVGSVPWRPDDDDDGGRSGDTKKGKPEPRQSSWMKRRWYQKQSGRTDQRQKTYFKWENIIFSPCACSFVSLRHCVYS